MRKMQLTSVALEDLKNNGIHKDVFAKVGLCLI